jgi:integrase
MRSDVKISKRTVDALICGPERQILWDSELRGFGVVALSSGIKSYFVNYRNTQGRYRRLTVGQHGRVTAEQARKIAKKHLGEIAGGKDPLAAREAQRKRERTTFHAVAEEFIAKHASKTRSGDETARMIRLYLLPRFQTKDIAEIGRRDITRLLDEIESAEFKAHDGRSLGGPVMADRVLAILRKMLNWHATRDDNFVSPIVFGMSRTKPRERARQRILSDEEIIAFWRATGELASEGDVFASIARTLLVTAQRRDEVAHMKKLEMRDDLWTIPEERYKNGKPNVVPLSALAISTIKSAPSPGQLIFSTTGDKPYSGFSRSKRRLDQRMLDKLEELSKERNDDPLHSEAVTLRKLMTASSRGDQNAHAELDKRWWTLHDLRRTAKTLMVRAGVRPDVSERVLGHIIPGVEGIYDRHSYIPEKRNALERLAAQIHKIVSPNGSNVVHMARDSQIILTDSPKRKLA